MARTFDEIDDELGRWLEDQPVYFVGTAPSGTGGHVNISPKGARGTFRVLGTHSVAYLDLIGSGVETIAHLRDNGRIVVMFCAFNGPPRVVRLHGSGRTIQQSDPDFNAALAHFSPDSETRRLVRSVIQVDVTRLSVSCGFVVPQMEFVEERDALPKWSRNQERRWGENWKDEYIVANNLSSIDALPGLDSPGAEPTEELVRTRSSEGRAL